MCIYYIVYAIFVKLERLSIFFYVILSVVGSQQILPTHRAMGAGRKIIDKNIKFNVYKPNPFHLCHLTLAHMIFEGEEASR